MSDRGRPSGSRPASAAGDSAVADLEIMEHADGEHEGDDTDVSARLDRDPGGRVKLESIKQLGELVRGHLELSAEAVHDARFAAMWRRIDGELDVRPAGMWSRVAGWFDRHRGHILTGAVSAGAVAALALVLRPGDPTAGVRGGRHGAIDVRPVALRTAPEIDALDTPGGSSTVISMDDEDGHTTVIWVTPVDTVEGI